MKGFLIITALGLFAMLAEIFRLKKILFPIVLLGIAAAWAINLGEWNTPLSISYFDNMISFDRPALAFTGIILVTAFLWFILSKDYFEQGSAITDHFALVLFTITGAIMMTSFKNLCTLFLGLEIMSIPLYVLAASNKKDLKSNEAGFKYLIMGSFASAFLLFGIALVYGAFGTFDIDELRLRIAENVNTLPAFFYTGVLMMLIAMCFKVSAAPFHFWAPDVYEGSPTLITALMSTIVKTAAFASILKLFMIVFADASKAWSSSLAAIIALSLVIANFTAAVQNSVKRMLAFSSISHAAFMLMVVLGNVRSNLSLDAILYYSLAYSIGSITAFGVLHNVGRNGNEHIDAFNGLGKRNPMLALFMTIAMLSLAGIPVTAGFFAKYFVFTTLIGSGYKWLLILAIITSAIGVYYYLRVVIAMYFKPSTTEEAVEMRGADTFVIAISSVLTLVIGIAPGMITRMFAV
jgi:NADH-quinone oxidoreductase subunit N